MNKRHPVAYGVRKAPGEMNKLEAKYAQHLDEQKHFGKIIDFWYERVTLKLADAVRYTPDFMVLTSDLELELHEVKGYMQEDARVKLRTAADKFPFRFKLIHWLTKKEAAAKGVEVGWEIVEI
jgi:hypothetical protein